MQVICPRALSPYLFYVQITDRMSKVAILMHSIPTCFKVLMCVQYTNQRWNLPSNV
ncbi:hypothetical protein [Helicobacter salomonis]|uniref:hypothetical protein n=1 Tax=Helicobacter salomonis TaxID=56878 RepID=UPI00131551E3|nr:hypothetical protein [Helicobacter salomonis]